VGLKRLAGVVTSALAHLSDASRTDEEMMRRPLRRRLFEPSAEDTAALHAPFGYRFRVPAWARWFMHSDAGDEHERTKWRVLLYAFLHLRLPFAGEEAPLDAFLVWEEDLLGERCVLVRRRRPANGSLIVFHDCPEPGTVGGTFRYCDGTRFGFDDLVPLVDVVEKAPPYVDFGALFGVQVYVPPDRRNDIEACVRGALRAHSGGDDDFVFYSGGVEEDEGCVLAVRRRAGVDVSLDQETDPGSTSSAGLFRHARTGQSLLVPKHLLPTIAPAGSLWVMEHDDRAATHGFRFIMPPEKVRGGDPVDFAMREVLDGPSRSAAEFERVEEGAESVWLRRQTSDGARLTGVDARARVAQFGSTFVPFDGLVRLEPRSSGHYGYRVQLPRHLSRLPVEDASVRAYVAEALARVGIFRPETFQLVRDASSSYCMILRRHPVDHPHDTLDRVSARAAYFCFGPNRLETRVEFRRLLDISH